MVSSNKAHNFTVATLSNPKHSRRRSLLNQNLLVIKELQTDEMPRREALQTMNEIDLHGQLANVPFVVKYIDSFISGQNKVNIVMEFC